MQVGVNYPWPYNWFGDHMTNQYGQAWVREALPADLRAFKARGIRVVRLWLLCDLVGAHTWGSAEPIKTVFGVRVGWRVVPPPAAPDEYFSALELIFEAFANEGVQVMPVILSFEAFRYRYGIASDPSVRREFMRQIVRKMAQVSARYPAALHSWDVCNEIAWNIAHPDITLVTLTPHHARAYLGDCFDTIEAVAREAAVTLDTTAGHASALSFRLLQTGSVPQFHYYPLLRGALPDYRGKNAPVLGEFSTRVGTRWRDRDPQHHPWPELHGGDTSSQYLAVNRRLWAAHDKGYDLALMWPDGIQPEVSASGIDKYSPEVWRAVDDFHRGVRS